MKVSVSKWKNQTIYYLLHRPDSLSHSGEEVRWELYHWKHYKNTERNEHADSSRWRIYPWVYTNWLYRQTPRHIWFQNGLRDCISERYKKDFDRNKKVEILLEFKKKTRAPKWRNYAVYGLLTLSQLSKTGVSPNPSNYRTLSNF